MPPMTIVSPSLTNTLASASRFSSSKGMTPAVPPGTVAGAVELDFTLIFIKTNSSLETWGMTVRIIPTGTCSVATAVPAAAPLPLAMFVDDGKAILSIRSLLMVEGTLFNVTIEGREMILIWPSLSAAERMDRTLVAKKQNGNPEAGIGKIGSAPAGDPEKGSDAKNRELPSTRLLLNSASNSIPRDFENVGVVSTRLDSIRTCGVRESNFPTNMLTSSIALSLS